jgi:hypothetical protein
LSRAGLDTLKLGDGPFVSDITGIPCGFGLDQYHVNFFIGDGAMLDAPGNNDEFTRMDDSLAMAKLHAESAFRDQEQFVFLIVMMPDKFSFDLYGFDVRVVELPDDARMPIVREAAEFFGQTYGLHKTPSLC